MSNLKNIYINSSPNFIDIGGTDSQFTISKPFSNFTLAPKKVKLLSARIPYTWNNITSINNQFSLIEYPGPVSYGETIPSGRYTASTLASELQTILNNTPNKLNTYTVSYDTNSMKFTISATGNFQLDFTGSNSIGTALGFGPVLTPEGTSIQSTGVAVLQSDNEIFITSSLVSGIDNGIVPWFTESTTTNYPDYGILASVPINTCWGGVINYQTEASEPWQDCSQSSFSYQTISGTSVQIGFGLFFLSGTPVDLNGAHWSANISLQF